MCEGVRDGQLSLLSVWVYCEGVTCVQGTSLESSRFSEGIIVRSGGKEHYFSMFTRVRETLELMEQLAKIATKE